MSDKVKLSVPDKDGRNDLEFEIDWSTRQSAEFYRVSMGDKTATIRKEDLWKVIFMTVPEDKQDELLPVQTNVIRTYHKMVKIKASEDIKKGDTLNVRVAFDIPEEVIVKRGESGILIPKAP